MIPDWIARAVIGATHTASTQDCILGLDAHFESTLHAWLEIAIQTVLG